MTPSSEPVSLFPAMPLAQWADTKDTVHRMAQIVGKLRLAHAPPRNHWWHVPFHLTGRGMTTRPMGNAPIFAIEFDFVAHRLIVNTLAGDTASFTLPGLSVAAFYRRLMTTLTSLGIDPTISATPFDLADKTPFANDNHHASYDPAAVTRYWRILSQVALVLEEFAGRSYVKTSPVHHFWHTFDIAVTRVSDKPVTQPDTVDAVTRQAYSHELISFGFWFGDDTVGEPAFYSYTTPEPDGLTDEPLEPAAAAWIESRGAHLALLRYDDARAAADPQAAVLDFYESAYRAGGVRAGWDIQALSTTSR